METLKTTKFWTRKRRRRSRLSWLRTTSRKASTDAAGIGESAGIITLAAAIGNAFYNATGVRMRRIPMTPANVLAALGKVQAEVQA